MRNILCPQPAEENDKWARRRKGRVPASLEANNTGGTALRPTVSDVVVGDMQPNGRRKLFRLPPLATQIQFQHPHDSRLPMFSLQWVPSPWSVLVGVGGVATPAPTLHQSK